MISTRLPLFLSIYLSLYHSVEGDANKAPKFLRDANQLIAETHASDVQDGTQDGYGPINRCAIDRFQNCHLKGRFSYSNLAGDVASLSVGVFDGNGNISEFDDIRMNTPSDGNGGRAEVSIAFNSGTYEVYPNGRGKIIASMGEDGGPYYDPPAEIEFVITSTGDDGREVLSMDSHVVAQVGVSNQLVAPRWSKISDA